MTRDCQREDVSLASRAQQIIEKAKHSDEVLWAGVPDHTPQCPACGIALDYSEDDWVACSESPDVLFRALKVGRLRGIAVILACDNGGVKGCPDYVQIARELIQRDILVIVSGCISSGMNDAGLMALDAIEVSGGGLKEFSDYLDVAPVIFTANWSKILLETDLFNRLADHAGEECGRLPVVVVALEWPHDKEGDIGPFDTVNDIDVDSTRAADFIDLHIHHKRLQLDWCDQFHCSIHS